MKLGQAIEKCEEDNPNVLESDTLTDIINELEGRVLTEVIETFVPIVIDITDNTIVAPLEYIISYPRADLITASGNSVTVQSAYWEQDVTPTTENIPVTVV